MLGPEVHGHCVDFYTFGCGVPVVCVERLAHKKKPVSLLWRRRVRVVMVIVVGVVAVAFIVSVVVSVGAFVAVIESVAVAAVAHALTRRAPPALQLVCRAAVPVPGLCRWGLCRCCRSCAVASPSL